MKKIKLIVGLANPIKKWNSTRHNVGAWFIQSLAFQKNIILKKNKKFLGYYSKIYLFSKNIYLLIPDTFMNLSGISVHAISKFFNIELNEILIVHDELDLKPGVVKFKFRSSHNGHNGVRNIISVLGKSINFARICIGIGRPTSRSEVSKFVLSEPEELEKTLIKQAILNAINIAYYLIDKHSVIASRNISNINLESDINKRFR